MESRAALGVAAALALTVTGGVSALFLTVGQASGTDGPENQPAVTVEYVDQYGNPVATPAPVSTGTATPEIILVNPDGTIVDQQPAAESDVPYGGPTYSEEYEEGEHEEAETYEEEGEYASGEHAEEDEYEEDEHEEGEYEEDEHEEGEYEEGEHEEGEYEEGDEHEQEEYEDD